MNQRRRLVSLTCHGDVIPEPGANRMLQVTAAGRLPRAGTQASRGVSIGSRTRVAGPMAVRAQDVDSRITTQSLVRILAPETGQKLLYKTCPPLSPLSAVACLFSDRISAPVGRIYQIIATITARRVMKITKITTPIPALVTKEEPGCLKRSYTLAPRLGGWGVCDSVMSAPFLRGAARACTAWIGLHRWPPNL
jgi:hypothetical protein